MNRLSYLAVIEKTESGTYSIYFPDLPGCISVGDTIDETIDNAQEALSLHYYGMLKDGDEIPKPSEILDKKDTDGNLICPITIYPKIVIDYFENKKVKTNCVLPAWLKEKAESCHVNYSHLLESALIEYLELNNHS